MSEVNSVTYLKDYQQPDYWVTHVDLTVDLREGETLVRAVLQVKKKRESYQPAGSRWRRTRSTGSQAE